MPGWVPRFLCIILRPVPARVNALMYVGTGFKVLQGHRIMLVMTLLDILGIFPALPLFQSFYPPDSMVTLIK